MINESLVDEKNEEALFHVVICIRDISLQLKLGCLMVEWNQFLAELGPKNQFDVVEGICRRRCNQVKGCRAVLKIVWIL